ncbi:MAG TPA: hypothetical protein VJ994_02305 [Paracoccaceae bacterium]|nr:hypothetical protein [Paracoccaceae bacterium]
MNARRPGAGGLVVVIPVSPGGLIDRLAVLELRLDRPLTTPERAFLAEELAALQAARDASLPADAELDALSDDLAEVVADQRALVEDLVRAEARGDFGPAFVALARASLRLADRRAALRRAIDLHLGARFPEPPPRPPY